MNGCAPADGWQAAITDIRKLLKAKPNIVQFEMDDPAPPLVDALEVRFNGVGVMGHETFLIRSDGAEDFCSNFTKTAQKPYDLLVTACLLVFKASMPAWISLGSDGPWRQASGVRFTDGWGAAEKLCRRVLKYTDRDFVAAKADLDRK